MAAAVVQEGLLGYLLVSMRLAGLLLLAPPLASMAVPGMVRMAFVLVLGAVLWQGQSVQIADPGLPALLLLSLREFANGALMALGVHLAFAAFGFGARLLDVQIGYGMGQVFDPMTRTMMPVLTAAFALLAPVLFLLSDSHHLLLRAVALSLEHFPIGSSLPADAMAQALFRQVQALFSLGLAMVAPVVFCLVLIEFALGVVARNLPQMNVFVLGIPVKLLAGLLALSAWMAAATSPFTRAFDLLFRGWEAALR
ncbi:MAG TPA: flagellar biosynthetic protein FliR [Anaerolineae bacterium]|nr:flagellar biosynthetic protein FliR [Anaerolineae bacterium]